MAESPYEILGVDENASLDEVKKAYRKKARENHPDLNPNDPDAAERMNKINEAYDRIMNPDKYAASDRRRQQSSTSSSQGYGGSTGYGQQGYGTGGYGQTTQDRGGYGGYRSDGPGGWTGDFDFDDFFGYGAYTNAAPVHPGVIAGDSSEMVAAINAINSDRSAEAIKILSSIPSTGRNARWHYISAVANKYAGNEMRALEHIRKAIQMDPGNSDYERAQNWISQQAYTYRQQGNARGFSMDMTSAAAICCGLWVCMPTMCSFCSPYHFLLC